MNEDLIRDEDPDHRYVDLDRRRPGKLPDFRYQPQDGNRQLSEHAAKVGEAGKNEGLHPFLRSKMGSCPGFFQIQNFSGVV